MTRQEEKQRLRQTMRELERQLSDKYKRNSSRAICAHLVAMPEYQAADTVFCFVGTNREIDTHPILEDCLAAGKRLCVPLCTGPGIMELRQIADLSQLICGSYGIQEPPADAPSVAIDDVDLSIIPCLTCDHGGKRLGQGGGYYDRFLSSYRAAAVMACRSTAVRSSITYFLSNTQGFSLFHTRYR